MSHNGAAIAALRRKIAVVEKAEKKLVSAINEFSDDLTKENKLLDYEKKSWKGQRRDKYNDSYSENLSEYSRHIGKQTANIPKMDKQIAEWEAEIARLEAEDDDD